MSTQIFQPNISKFCVACGLAVHGEEIPLIFNGTNNGCCFCHEDDRLRKVSHTYWKQKAVATYEKHRQKFLHKGIIKASFEMQSVLCWSIEKLTVLFSEAMQRGYCSECVFFYKLERHHPNMPSLDIIEPSKLPVWNNIRVICLKCNTKKGRLSVSDFQIKKKVELRRNRKFTDHPRQVNYELFKSGE